MPRRRKLGGKRDMVTRVDDLIQSDHGIAYIVGPSSGLRVHPIQHPVQNSTTHPNLNLSKAIHKNQFRKGCMKNGKQEKRR